MFLILLETSTFEQIPLSLEKVFGPLSNGNKMHAIINGYYIETYGDNLSPILALFQAKPLTSNDQQDN
jgi:hypothetical protein